MFRGVRESRELAIYPFTLSPRRTHEMKCQNLNLNENRLIHLIHETRIESLIIIGKGG